MAGLVDGSWSDAQVSALAMALLLRGMDAEETAALTGAMVDSGERLRWSSGEPVVDKHATGGVGDTTSLVLAPLLAACGLRVPMISGRGLAHTGGTLDKLESIPGFDVSGEPERLRRLLAQTRCAIVAQSRHLAPADRRLYAIRDVTATVPCPGLIVASILSKKLAAGLQHLVMDIKVGEGSFVADLEQGRALATSLEQVAAQQGLGVRCLLSDMNTPLSRHVGHALEVRAAIDVLCGSQQQPRLRELVLALAGAALEQAGMDANLACQQLDNGQAAEYFARMVVAQGGPGDLLDKPQAHLPQAPSQHAVLAEEDGQLTGWRARVIGELVMDLGGARRQPGDRIDHAVGISEMLSPGASYRAGDCLAFLHGADAQALQRAERRLRQALRSAGEPTPVLLPNPES